MDKNGDIIPAKIEYKDYVIYNSTTPYRMRKISSDDIRGVV